MSYLVFDGADSYIRAAMAGRHQSPTAVDAPCGRDDDADAWRLEGGVSAAVIGSDWSTAQMTKPIDLSVQSWPIRRLNDTTDCQRGGFVWRALGLANGPPDADPPRSRALLRRLPAANAARVPLLIALLSHLHHLPSDLTADGYVLYSLLLRDP